jgi:hypothetical protein
MPTIRPRRSLLKFLIAPKTSRRRYKKIPKNKQLLRIPTQALLHWHRKPHDKQPHLRLTLLKIPTHIKPHWPAQPLRHKMRPSVFPPNQRTIHAGHLKNPKQLCRHIKTAIIVLKQTPPLSRWQDPQV